MHPYIIQTDGQEENYTMTCETLKPTVSDFHKNQFSRKVKTTIVIPNDKPHINVLQTTSGINKIIRNHCQNHGKPCKHYNQYSTHNWHYNN